MYKVSREYSGGQRMATIIDVKKIRRSALLCPRFGPVQPPQWTSDNVLELCKTFYVNSHTDRHTFITVV